MATTEERLFCMRWDVDTHVCLWRGVPPLLRLGERVGIRFTFFVHMGRAVSRAQLVSRAMGRSALAEPGIEMLSPVAKLGRTQALIVLAANPRIGTLQPGKVSQIGAAGHEVGLHGGYNHSTFQANGANWGRERIRKELGWGREQLISIGLVPRGFASPGWSGSPIVDSVAAELGFDYVADRHGSSEQTLTASEQGLALVPTNIAGEPGGVGYLEWMRARDRSDAQVADDLRQRLEGCDGYAVCYDHPFWGAVQDIGRVELIIETAVNEGFRFVTLAEMVDSWRKRQ